MVNDSKADIASSSRVQDAGHKIPEYLSNVFYKADAKLILDYKTALNLNGVTTRTTVPSGATPTTTSGSTNAPHPAQMQLYGVLETLANIGKS